MLASVSMWREQASRGYEWLRPTFDVQAESSEPRARFVSRTNTQKSSGMGLTRLYYKPRGNKARPLNLNRKGETWKTNSPPLSRLTGLTKSTSGHWKRRMHPAGKPGVWIIGRNRWMSGLPSSVYAFRASRWRWHWNSLVGRWYFC